MLLDMLTYLPDDILTKVDRASMAVSLEAHVPLLDHRLVEFAWRVPTGLKYRDGQGKWLLRQVLYPYAHGAAEDGLWRADRRLAARSTARLGRGAAGRKTPARRGFFDPAPICRLWTEDLAGARRWHSYLWDVLMFEAWREKAAAARQHCAGQ